jgi:PAS domain-containing protein
MSDDDAGNEGQCDEEEESDSDSGSPSETESPGSSRQAQPHSASYAQSSVHSSGSSGISTNYSSSIAAKAPSALLSASSQFQANIQPSASSSSGSAFHPPSSSSAGIQLTPLGFSAAGGQSPIFGLTSPAAWPSFDFFSDFAAVTEASVSAAAASSSSSSSAAAAGAAATPGASSAGSSYNLEETLSRLSVDQRFRHLPILAYLVKLTQRRTIDVSAVQMLVDHLQHLQWPQTELLNPANDLDSMVARDVMLRHHVEDCSHLVQTSVFPALMIANHGRIYRYNSALVELSPFTRDELERPDFEPLELFDEECAPGMIRFIMQRKDNKKLVSGSLRVILKRKDGRKVEYCAGVTLLRDMSGNLVGTTTIFVPLPT